MTTRHAALWIDHNEARALALEPDGTGFQELAHVHAHDTHTHPKKLDGHRHPVDARFLADVERVIAGCDEVAVFGPGHAKEELVHHLERSGPALRARVVSVAPIDRITDGELAVAARASFVAVDRMRGVHVAR